jgi:hypothetical protein
VRVNACVRVCMFVFDVFVALRISCHGNICIDLENIDGESNRL